eukprot:6611487-Prymnesium_polylepis.1
MEKGNLPRDPGKISPMCDNRAGPAGLASLHRAPPLAGPQKYHHWLLCEKHLYASTTAVCTPIHMWVPRLGTCRTLP